MRDLSLHYMQVHCMRKKNNIFYDRANFDLRKIQYFVSFLFLKKNVDLSSFR